MNERLPRLVLFLHEDIIACTLSYEQQLQSWRLAELEAEILADLRMKR